MALTAYAGYEQAEGQKDMARYQADVAEKNADLDEFRAQQAATIGAVQEEQHRAKVRQLAGAQRADFAARGIDRKSVVQGKSVSGRVDFGGRSLIKKRIIKNKIIEDDG